MGYGIDRGFGYRESPHQITVCDVAEEMMRAREKFPSNEHLLAALTEEVGELAQAFIQKKPWDEIRGEAMQVACVAMRIMEEGDSTLTEPTPRGSPRWKPGGR
jgi:NTP pyrophosphatase (non-canonical NTP hydrolase)